MSSVADPDTMLTRGNPLTFSSSAAILPGSPIGVDDDDEDVDGDPPNNDSKKGDRIK
jgi:hypothetical protein